MDIERCLNCNNVFILYEDCYYCQDCGDFGRLVDEKVIMLMEAIEQRKNNG